MAKEVLPLTSMMSQAQRRELRHWDRKLRSEGLSAGEQGAHKKLNRNLKGYNTKGQRDLMVMI